MALPWGAIASVGSTLLGGLFGSSGAKKQNEAQLASAREQMDFQERMSNTAHTREVVDLKRAGLNPILSAKTGGASSPGGAQPNIVNELAPLENSARSLSDKAFSYRVQDAQVDNMRLQNDLLKKQIEQVGISNARQGLMTPAWETGGRIVDQIAAKLDGFLNGNDIVQDVMDAGGAAAGGILNLPSSAKAASEAFQSGRFEIPIGTKGSGARDFANGRKTFLQSFKEANDGSRNLTEEKLRAYGVRRLEELRKKHGFMKQK